VTIERWPVETTQVGADLEQLLPLFGATVRREGADLTIEARGLRHGEPLPGLELDLSRGGELAPAIVALAALASGPSRITGIGHLRGHETDRLAALVTEITRLGGDARELPDGIEILPATLHGGVVQTYHDHRMATFGAVIGLAVEGVAVHDVATTAKTLPDFPGMWRRMLGSGEVAAA